MNGGKDEEKGWMKNEGQENRKGECKGGNAGRSDKRDWINENTVKVEK